ncbi:hypothetical protein D9619_002213 [Psilocybe cf. subviscida]|uniref:Uncharacterized protein n=1 Tax=Psilocybe cf. subviscida TaxID=2480587 RepID=A0A8H5F2B6_9AGAR|nr:hypothetical protein D9619_002213 [Psilocybe cf. subviscida]
MSLRNRNSLLYLFLLLNVLILLLLQNDQINQNSFLQVQIYLPNQTHADTLTQHQPDTIMNPTQFPPTGPLTKWFQTRMETLLTTTPARSQQPPSITESYPVEPETQADFKSLFYTAFHPDAKITMNHQQVSQEDFIRQMEQSTMGLGPGGVQVDWRDILEIPSSDNQGQSAYGHEAGIVAGMFVATRSLKFRIRAGPAQRHSFNVFSARLHTSKSLSEVNADKEHPYLIADLVLTTHEQAAPIHMPGIHAPVQTVSMKDVEKRPLDGEGQ